MKTSAVEIEVCLAAALRALTIDFRFATAYEFATRALALMPGDLRELDDSSTRQAITAHEVLATVMRDRSDPKANYHVRVGRKLATSIGDYEAELRFLNIAVTASTNRRDIPAAKRALHLLDHRAAEMGSKILEHERRLKWSNMAEHAGDARRAMELAEALAKGPRNDDSAWMAAVCNAQARRAAKQMRSEALHRDRPKWLRLAFRYIEQSADLLAVSPHPIWEVTRLAALGFTLRAAGDFNSAREARDMAQHRLREIGIRNTWTEELGVWIGPGFEGKSDAIASSWARSLYKARSDPTGAYLNLFSAWDRILRIALESIGTEVKAKTPAKRVISLACSDKEGLGPDFLGVVTERELKELCDWRNLTAHELLEDSDWHYRLKRLMTVVERAEEILPPEVFEEALS